MASTYQTRATDNSLSSSLKCYSSVLSGFLSRQRSQTRAQVVQIIQCRWCNAGGFRNQHEITVNDGFFGKNSLVSACIFGGDSSVSQPALNAIVNGYGKIELPVPRKSLVDSRDLPES
ncbi:hypothetical protein AVEN_188015-1 [Araneus ventricosus]|uniref:Uncharacterized protein n=1 Tax=Araneus ventricosus TaxID=182803 RepID=A0A4Y2W0U9_ARAVE|nr:hypothetical protein AVEN_257945-1 [Araneus ventricosus]GBO30499.1 hypothetical protein AVEN_105663-1 [Araneus ventricosus]GBO30500.1 hypothetical protein AVEN_140206-1 [Araneus ventricosus]GBO30501.1 hypothetical protein AVEN_188015-1 [Araneus ventricosus]